MTRVIGGGVMRYRVEARARDGRPISVDVTSFDGAIEVAIAFDATYPDRTVKVFDPDLYDDKWDGLADYQRAELNGSLAIARHARRAEAVSRAVSTGTTGHIANMAAAS